MRNRAPLLNVAPFFVVLLLTGGCVYHSYQISSTTCKVEMPEFETPLFFLRDPVVKQADNFSGIYERESYETGKWQMKREGTFSSVSDRPLSALMSFNVLPGLKKLGETAAAEYPAVFSTAPGQALPLSIAVSLGSIDIVSKLSYQIVTENRLIWTVMVDCEDENGKRISIARKDFSMSYRMCSKIFVAPPLGNPSFPGRNILLESSSMDRRDAESGKVYDTVLTQSIIDSVAEIVRDHRGLLIQRAQARSRAISEEKIDRHWALVIGISGYKHGESGLTSLAFADRDAEAMAEVFHGKMNWPRSRIRTLINEEATQKNILEALEKITARMKENDLLTVYWSGHGFSRGEQTYLACYDTDANRPESAISMPEFRRLLDEKKARNVLFIADTCHAGGVATGMRGLSVVSYQAALQPEKAKTGGWIFMLASEADRQAVEDKSWGHGAFTYCLLKGLSGAADGYEGAGRPDGIITPAELRSYLSTRVPLETQEALGTAIHPLINSNSANPKIWEMNIYEDQN